MKIIFKILFLLLCSSHLYVNGQIAVKKPTGGRGAAELVDYLLGAGVTVSNISYVGVSYVSTTAYNNGFFSNGTPSIGIESGIVLSTGDVGDIGTNDWVDNTYAYGSGGDADIENYLGESGNMGDVIGIQFDFVPEGNVISFQYVFGSDEYNEYVGSAFNDGFCFLLTSLDADGYNYNKKNIAVVPSTTTPIAINNVNNGYKAAGVIATGPCTNCSYYVDNSTGAKAVECDGMTTVLTATAPVVACKRYRLKLVIGDVADYDYDSWVFFKENSLTSPSVDNVTSSYAPVAAGTAGVEGCNNITIRFNLSSATVGTRKVAFTFGGTATEPRLAGADYTTSPNVVPTWNTDFANKYYVTIPNGQNYFDLIVTPTYDGLVEADETIVVTVDTKLCSTTTVSGSTTIKDRSAISTSIPSGPTISVCEGGTATLTTSTSGGWTNGGGYTYSWSSNPAGFSSTAQNPVVTLGSTTIYTVTTTDVCGNSATANVTVAPLHNSGSYGLWYGDVSTDWNDCRNWGKGKVPISTTDVVIPTSGITYWPIKTGNITLGTDCNSITMQNATQLTINGNLTIGAGKIFSCLNTANIYISGNWSENATGTFNAGVSTVIFNNGSASQNVNNGLNKTYSFWNLIIDGLNVIFNYNGSSTNRINANNITINNGKKMSTVKQ